MCAHQFGNIDRVDWYFWKSVLCYSKLEACKYPHCSTDSIKNGSVNEAEWQVNRVMTTRDILAAGGEVQRTLLGLERERKIINPLQHSFPQVLQQLIIYTQKSKLGPQKLLRLSITPILHFSSWTVL